MGSTQWGDDMTYYTLEELEPDTGEIIVFVNESGLEYSYIYEGILEDFDGRAMWYCPEREIQVRPPKKKGYAKWVSEREGT
jgi:hypothetical protein